MAARGNCQLHRCSPPTASFILEYGGTVLEYLPEPIHAGKRGGLKFSEDEEERSEKIAENSGK